MRRVCYVGLLLCAGLCEAQQQERVVKITVANAAVRAGASTEYDRVTVAQPGIKLAVVRREGDWYRVRLGDAQEAYVSTVVCELLPEGTPPSQAKVTDVSARPFERGTRVTISISAPILFRITQRLRPAALEMELYNCRLAQYGVRQLEGADAILAIEQVQQSTNTAALTFHLPQAQQTGYDAYYNATMGGLIVEVRRPYQSGGVGDKLIGIDPGHGGIWSGAHGPTGLLEKDVNLDISLRLKQMLEMAGARVFMTRETDVGYGERGDPMSADLDPRRQMTRDAGVDLFVSVHNNHIGSGNGRGAAGTETYYWTPMSIQPARIIQDNTCAALGTQNRFISWRPFYVLRDTDCPRVLVECCYLSHPDEEAAMRTIDFRHRAAVGIFSGIREFFEKSMLTDGLELPELELEPATRAFG